MAPPPSPERSRCGATAQSKGSGDPGFRAAFPLIGDEGIPSASTKQPAAQHFTSACPVD